MIRYWVRTLFLPVVAGLGAGWLVSYLQNHVPYWIFQALLFVACGAMMWWARRERKHLREIETLYRLHALETVQKRSEPYQ